MITAIHNDLFNIFQRVTPPSSCETMGNPLQPAETPGFNIVPSKQQTYAEALGKECS